MYRDLLVHVDPTTGGRRRLAYALALAEVFDARLTGLHVRAPPDLPPLYKPSRIDQMLEEQDEHLALSAEKAEQLFRSATAAARIPVRWRAASGNMARGIADMARYADLVIVGQYEHEGSYVHHPLALAEDVVRISGRPVIVTPSRVGPGQVERAAVAWDGGAQAVRALHDALPLLEKAADVAVITVGDVETADEAARDLRELADHLTQHGIGADRIRSVHAGGQHTGAILEQLRAGGFDLLVMGAFGHPAWLELIFGGTTYDVLESSPVPVLISR